MSQNSVPYFKAWIIFAICSTLLAVFAGMAIGFILGFIMGFAGVPIETIQLVCAIAGAILGLVASYATFRWVVDRFILPAVTAPPQHLT